MINDDNAILIYTNIVCPEEKYVKIKILILNFLRIFFHVYYVKSVMWISLCNSEKKKINGLNISSRSIGAKYISVYRLTIYVLKKLKLW